MPKKPAKSFSLTYELGSKDYTFLSLLDAFERTIRLYDLRGDYRFFDKEYVRRIGRALGTSLAEGKCIAVSGDNRESTEPLKKALIKAINETGVDVLDLGMSPTPVTYLSNFLLDDPVVSGSVMITASHCEKHENGLKIVLDQHACYGDDLKKLAAAALSGQFRLAARPGTKRFYNINPHYNQVLERRVESLRDRMDQRFLATVVIDGGHGLIGPRAVKVYERDLGLHMHKMYCSPDRSFSAHSPDPARKRNMVNLASTVAAYQDTAILGMAFDGDGDRLSMVDCTGKLYFGPELTTIFIVRMVRGAGKGRFAVDAQLPLSMIRWIAGNLKNGICIIREPGNPQFKETILEEKLHFGGETSGHFFFTPLEDNPRHRHVAVDDGLLASLHMVEFLYQSGQPFHDLARSILSEVDDGSTVIWSKRFSLPEEQRQDVLALVRDRFRPHLPDLGKQIRFSCSQTLKQLKDDLSEALTIRPSQTEPVLKVQWEGPLKRKTAAKADLKRELAACFREVKAPLPPELA